MDGVDVLIFVPVSDGHQLQRLIESESRGKQKGGGAAVCRTAAPPRTVVS